MTCTCNTHTHNNNSNNNKNLKGLPFLLKAKLYTQSWVFALAGSWLILASAIVNLSGIRNPMIHGVPMHFMVEVESGL